MVFGLQCKVEMGVLLAWDGAGGSSTPPPLVGPSRLDMGGWELAVEITPCKYSYRKRCCLEGTYPPDPPLPDP